MLSHFVIFLLIVFFLFLVCCTSIKHACSRSTYICLQDVTGNQGYVNSPSLVAPRQIGNLSVIARAVLYRARGVLPSEPQRKCALLAGLNLKYHPRTGARHMNCGLSTRQAYQMDATCGSDIDVWRLG
ncbi:hypothetical protein QBC44DRAFT_322015 [Cladorrhinum sp. PSN332]|nr:hypothetical protein QBC44DRAFT_322015 [Cladorrhinum sp. PSN332]